MPENNLNSQFSNPTAADLAASSAEAEAQAELLDLVMLEYIDRDERGQNPTLAEYVARYPELRQGLTERVAEYWQQGREILAQAYEREADPAFQAQIAASRQDPAVQAQAKAAAELIMQQMTARAEVAPLADLNSLIQAQNLKPPQVARQVGVTTEILTALRKRVVTVGSIPRVLVERLAEVLQTNVAQLVAYFRQPPLASANYLSDDRPTAPNQQSFAAYINNSALDDTAKSFWLNESAQNPLSTDAQAEQ